MATSEPIPEIKVKQSPWKQTPTNQHTPLYFFNRTPSWKKYCPGASVVPASSDPIITVLAPSANALAICPTFCMPPSAMTGTPNLLAYSATLYTAVPCGLPTANTSCSVCVCVCVCARARVREFVRERERVCVCEKGGREGECVRERGELERERERECVCVHVRERGEGGLESVCVCVHVPV